MAETSSALLTTAAAGFASLLTYVGMRLQTAAAERNAAKAATASVEVARIEADKTVEVAQIGAHTETEKLLLDLLKISDARHDATVLRLAECEDRAHKAEAKAERLVERVEDLNGKIEVLTREARKLGEDRDIFLEIIVMAGLQSHLTRTQQEMAERNGSTGHSIDEILPELSDNHREAT